MQNINNKEKRSISGEWGLIVEIDTNLWRVRLKNPSGSLMINTYVFRDSESFAVFDPGWPWTLEGLEHAFRESGLGQIEDVTHWIYTHSHIDHMGSASLIADRSEAPHYLSEWLTPHLDEWHKFIDDANDWVDWAEDAIVEKEIVAFIRLNRDTLIAEKKPMLQRFGKGKVRNVSFLKVNDSLNFSDKSFQVLDVRGHDPTHIAFYEKEKKWLISGDVVLSTPTPISMAMNDDIVLYEKSLDRLLALDVDLLLPGHGVHKRKNYHRTVQRSLNYLKTYEKLVIDILKKTEKAMSLMEICFDHDAEILKRDPTYASVQIGLFDSHLQHLVLKNRVNKWDGPTYSINDESE